MDIKELQQKCAEIKQSAEPRRRRQKEHARRYEASLPPATKWDYLRDYRGQWLSTQEFRARLLAARDRGNQGFYEAMAGYEYSRDKYSDEKPTKWKRKTRRK